MQNNITSKEVKLKLIKNSNIEKMPISLTNFEVYPGDVNNRVGLYLIHDGCDIDDDTKVVIYEYYNPTYYDIVLVKREKEYFIARYSKVTKNILTSCRFNKILIYSAEFDKVNGGLNLITKVIGLYNYKDNMFYCLSESEALRRFDPNLDRSHLIDPERLTIDNDMRIKKKIYNK